MATAVLAAAFKANDEDAELVAELVRDQPETCPGHRRVRGTPGGMRGFFDRNMSPYLARMSMPTKASPAGKKCT